MPSSNLLTTSIVRNARLNTLDDVFVDLHTQTMLRTRPIRNLFVWRMYLAQRDARYCGSWFFRCTSRKCLIYIFVYIEYFGIRSAVYHYLEFKCAMLECIMCTSRTRSKVIISATQVHWSILCASCDAIGVELRFAWWENARKLCFARISIHWLSSKSTKGHAIWLMVKFIHFVKQEVILSNSSSIGKKLREEKKRSTNLFFWRAALVASPSPLFL